MSNVTLLPDHMLGEVIARTHDHDLLAFLSSCKTFKRILGLDAKRKVKPPPNTHGVTSLALLEWALGSGWARPTKNACTWGGDLFAACALTTGGGCIAVLQRARADGCQWNESACAFAVAFCSRLEMLKWLRGKTGQRAPVRRRAGISSA